MEKIILIIISIFLVSCNPCRYVAKHSECFSADTIVINNEVIHHEKIFIKNDSIIHDTIPCDPITNTYYKTKTVYQTKTIEKTDTIYQDKTTTKINPINSQLQKENKKLANKVEIKNKWLKILGALSFLLIFILILIFKFK